MRKNGTYKLTQKCCHLARTTSYLKIQIGKKSGWSAPLYLYIEPNLLCPPIHTYSTAFWHLQVWISSSEERSVARKAWLHCQKVIWHSSGIGSYLKLILSLQVQVLNCFMFPSGNALLDHRLWEEPIQVPPSRAYNGDVWVSIERSDKTFEDNHFSSVPDDYK